MSTPSNRESTRPARQWRRPIVEEHIKQHPIPLAAAIGAGAAIAFGLIATFTVVMSAWLIAAHGNESVNQVLAASGIAWLGLQLVPVTIGTQVLGLLPWGFVVLPIYLLWRSTHWSLKSANPKTARDYWLVGGLLAATYGLTNTLLGFITSSNGLAVNPFEVFLRTSALAGLVCVICILSYAPSRTELIDWLPENVRLGVKPGFTAFMVMVLFGATLSSVSMIIHFKEISAVAEVMAPVSIDGFFLCLLGIGYLPTAAIWALSYLVGPGIVVGGTGVVSMYQANPGALPAFPLLSVLPDAAISWNKFLIVAPIAVGVLLYFLLPRSPWQASGESASSVLRGVLRPSELISLASALIVAMGCTLIVTIAASGSIGSQLLKSVGPNPLSVSTAFGTILAIAALVLIMIPRLLLALVFLWQGRSKESDKQSHPDAMAEAGN